MDEIVLNGKIDECISKLLSQPIPVDDDGNCFVEK